MDETTNDLEIPPEALAPTLEQAMELWVRPEIERRRTLGLVVGVFNLTAAQVITRRHGHPAHGTALRRPIEAGQWLGMPIARSQLRGARCPELPRVRLGEDGGFRCQGVVRRP